MWSREPAAVAACVVLLVLSLAACTGGSGEGETGETRRPAPTPTRTEGAPSLRARPAPYDVGYRTVAGALPRRKRPRTLRAVSRPVRTWVDRGFVEGPWPRSRFRAAFVPFTADVTRPARRDVGLLTLRGLGSDLVEVIPERRRVRVSVTARDGRPVGATARLGLRVLGVDQRQRRARVHLNGAVYLTRTRSGWQIFGYDLDRWVERGAMTRRPQGGRR